MCLIQSFFLITDTQFVHRQRQLGSFFDRIEMRIAVAMIVDRFKAAGRQRMICRQPVLTDIFLFACQQPFWNMIVHRIVETGIDLKAGGDQRIKQCMDLFSIQLVKDLALAMSTVIDRRSIDLYQPTAIVRQLQFLGISHQLGIRTPGGEDDADPAALRLQQGTFGAGSDHIAAVFLMLQQCAIHVRNDHTYSSHPPTPHGKHNGRAPWRSPAVHWCPSQHRPPASPAPSHCPSRYHIRSGGSSRYRFPHLQKR